MTEHRFKRYLPVNTLVGRFFLASLVLLPLFISVSATLLINAFEHSQLRAEQEKLQAQFYLLLSQTEVEKQQPQLPDALTEPRFNQQNSGLYGFIYSDRGPELWRSTSAALLQHRLFDSDLPFDIGTPSFMQSSDNHEPLNVFIFDVEWINIDNSVTPLRYIIASDNIALSAEISSYRKRLWQWLSLMGACLIIVQMLIMRWGLSPLKRLSHELTELQKNTIQRLDNHYPLEIRPVTDNFNSILEHEKKQRERYRNTMADLAHSLKTPLAVIQSQLDEPHQSTDLMRDQIQRINQIISHQLQRAVIKVNQNGLGLSTDKIPVSAMVKRLIKILEKVYTEKQIHFHTLIKDDIVFYGDEADLLEVLGNLLDNACKYGHHEVMITAEQNEQQLSIHISDNGSGIPETLQNTLLARGARGDTAQAGQGIGLSVAVDILSSYGGSLTVTNNNGKPHLSGACFNAVFPQQLG